MRKSLALIAITIPFALAACGGDDEGTTSAAAPETTSTSGTAQTGGAQTIDISETEYKLDPADPSAKAGEVTFAVANDGSTVHTLEVEGDGVEEETEDIQPGASSELTVDLEAGTYEIYCSIGGHKDLGMEGELTVD